MDDRHGEEAGEFLYALFKPMYNGLKRNDETCRYRDADRKLGLCGTGMPNFNTTVVKNPVMKMPGSAQEIWRRRLAAMKKRRMVGGFTPAIDLGGLTSTRTRRPITLLARTGCNPPPMRDSKPPGIPGWRFILRISETENGISFGAMTQLLYPYFSRYAITALLCSLNAVLPARN